jgi:hypothetical protein
MGQVLLAGEESQERTALLRVMVADGTAQHGIAGLERVERRALRGGAFDFERHLAADVRQGSEMLRENYSNHVLLAHLSVWTSTESTPGRSRTMGAQLSPASAEAYTWPLLVPKYTPHLSSESTAMASRNTLT